MDKYNTIKLFFGGDFCAQNRVLKKSKDRKYDELFGELRDRIATSDYSILNLESPLLDEQTHFTEILKSGPHVKAPAKSVQLLKFLGVKAVGLANNHMLDYGQKGLESTMNALDKSNISYCGLTSGEGDYGDAIRLTIKNKRIVILNYCENEFSTINSKLCCNSYDVISICRKIKEEKNNNAIVILFIHSGVEGFSYPTLKMKKDFHFFIENGADAIITHHSHCFSGYEIYRKKPIFYGIGNLSFDEENREQSKWNYGYCVELIIVGCEISFKVYPYIQGTPKIPGIKFLERNEKEYEYFFNQLDIFNNIILDDVKLLSVYNEYVKSISKYYLTFLSPYSHGILRVAVRHKLLPDFLFKRKKTLLLNVLRCESHYELLKESLLLEYQKYTKNEKH